MPPLLRTTASDAPEDLEQRLMALEMKLTFTEDTVERLNDVVVHQQDQLDALLKEVRRLAGQVLAAEPTPFLSLRDELPPHY